MMPRLHEQQCVIFSFKQQTKGVAGGGVADMLSNRPYGHRRFLDLVLEDKLAVVMENEPAAPQ